MKKILFSLSLLVTTTTAFSANFVLINQTAYPQKNPNSKIAIQWANSAKEVDDSNKALMLESKVNPDTVQMLNQAGKMNITIPEKAQYFRVVAWSKSEGDPDLLTNWVDIVPNKTYTLEADHLVPAVLMAGTGC